MRTPLRILAVAAVAAVPAIPAIAAQPTTPPATSHKPACAPAPHAGVAFIVRGTLTADATATSISFKVTGGNYFGKKATKDAPADGITVELGTCTKLNKISRHRKVTTQSWEKLKAGDRVVVKWVAKRGTALADLGPARRVVELRNLPAKP